VPGQELTGGPELPPIRLILDRPPPDGIGSLPPAEQVRRLRSLVRTDPRPRRLVELGSALQALRQSAAAGQAYRLALSRDPNDLAARAGLAMVEAAGGGAGPARAAAAMDELARRNPRSQLVAFNRGWLAAYRGDAAVSVAAWKRAASLDARSPLGTAARSLVRAVAANAGAASP
jgi:hypothetical protein